MDRSNECTWPEVKQRAHYLCWFASALATAALVGLTFDFMLVVLTGGTVGFDIIPLVYASLVAVPAVHAWRKHGEVNCGFLELERALGAAMRGAELSGTYWFAQIERLIERIDSSRGMDRQVVRNEAKAWLHAHADKLSPEERHYVADHLGYLYRS